MELYASWSAEIKQRDAELLSFVGQVVGDAGTGEHKDSDGQSLEQLVVALEGDTKSDREAGQGTLVHR